jgi:hypothetical protein
MRLSEQLKQMSDSGDFGKAIDGLSEKAKGLEDTIITTHIILEKIKLAISIGRSELNTNGVKIVILTQEELDELLKQEKETKRD